MHCHVPVLEAQGRRQGPLPRSAPRSVPQSVPRLVPRSAPRSVPQSVRPQPAAQLLNWPPGAGCCWQHLWAPLQSRWEGGPLELLRGRQRAAPVWLPEPSPCSQLCESGTCPGQAGCALPVHGVYGLNCPCLCISLCASQAANKWPPVGSNIIGRHFQQRRQLRV